MSQRIEIVKGDPVVAESLQEIFRSLIQPGILEGFELITLTGNRVGVNPGAGFLDAGAFIFDNEIRTPASAPTIVQSSPADYTVLYSFTTSQVLGGEAAVLQIVPGLLNPDVFQNGLILGWLRYPGGNVSLSNNMFVSGRRIQVGQSEAKLKNEFTTTFAPLSSKWALVSVTPSLSNLSLTEGWNNTYSSIITQVSNVGAGLMTAIYYVPIEVPSLGIGQLMMDVQVDGSSTCTVTLVDSVGNEITPLGTNQFINTPLSRKIVQIPQNTSIALNSVAHIKLELKIQPTNAVRFKTVGFSSYTEPF